MSEEMNIVDHIGELRKRILITLFSFLIAFVVSFIFVRDIYLFLVKDLEDQLALLGPADILWVYMMIAGTSALAVTLPIAALQVWKFVQPALTKTEQKTTLGFIPALFFLFLAGIGFGYFILFPLVVSFLEGLAGNDFATFFTVEKYFTFMLHLTVPFGFLFEMPAVIMFLTKLGIIDPVKLAKARKYSYLALVALSVLITPPDFMSDVLVIIPLLGLYEISIMISRIVYRKRLTNMPSSS
ncbi:sec-independent protein translocase protein TatC [Alteribacillus persepolensis]|uniref:Sec-independent protein translocase protein TatC n=1 Tax=Alteribacillus persepolensis TaxID=568899 RepID=A0A1G8FVI1_9BACI|nr:twin-arginine translocase subunit TatC [Alteribacillus persepolensis]SDH85966.1 sec-independent protein translocase protein TatC [Alteribacillus persepolensis]